MVIEECLEYLPRGLQLAKKIPLAVKRIGPFWAVSAEESLGKHEHGFGLSLREAKGDLAQGIVGDYICFKAFADSGPAKHFVDKLDSYLLATSA